MTRSKLKQAQEDYRWAKYAIRAAIRDKESGIVKGYLLTSCGYAKKRLRYCCNQMHSALSWKDADLTRLRA